MTIQNSFVALILITSLLCVTSQTNESSSSPIGILEQVAQDAINITIAEVSYAKAFMDLILNLKSIENVRGQPGDQVLQCVGGLSDGMSDVLCELKKLQQLDSGSSMYEGTRYLENMVDGVVSFNDICHHALEDVDETINLMVHRKLEDIVLLSNDVIFRVSKLHFDAKVTWKP